MKVFYATVFLGFIAFFAEVSFLEEVEADFFAGAFFADSFFCFSGALLGDFMLRYFSRLFWASMSPKGTERFAKSLLKLPPLFVVVFVPVIFNNIQY